MIFRTLGMIKYLAESGVGEEHRCTPGLRAEPERQVSGCRCGVIWKRVERLLDAISTFGGPDPVAEGQRITRGDLVPGRVVWRHTDNSRGAVRAWVPCHEEHSVLTAPGNRGAVVRCRARSCGLTYLLLLVDEQDGGYAARWTVAPYVEITDTTTRGGRQP